MYFFKPLSVLRDGLRHCFYNIGCWLWFDMPLFSTDKSVNKYFSFCSFLLFTCCAVLKCVTPERFKRSLEKNDNSPLAFRKLEKIKYDFPDPN